MDQNSFEGAALTKVVGRRREPIYNSTMRIIIRERNKKQSEKTKHRPFHLQPRPFSGSSKPSRTRYFYYARCVNEYFRSCVGVGAREWRNNSPNNVQQAVAKSICARAELCGTIFFILFLVPASDAQAEMLLLDSHGKIIQLWGVKSILCRTQERQKQTGRNLCRRKLGTKAEGHLHDIDFVIWG